MTSVRPPVLMILLFCVIAIGAVLFLRPDTALRREADLAQMAPTAALAELGDYVDYGSEEQGLAQTHARLAFGAGDFDLARALFADLAASFPEDPSLWEMLAQAEEVAGDFSTAADHLARAHALEPTIERRNRLGLLYRILDRQEEEAALLIDAPAADLSASDLDRAVALLLAAGKTEAVGDLYLRVISQAPSHADPVKERLIAFLVDLGRSDEAYAHAIDWIEQKPHDPALPANLVRSFIARGDIDAGLRIGEHQLSREARGMGRIVLRFAETGHGALARMLQSEWLARAGDLSDDDWFALSEMAARTGDLAGLRTALARPQTPAPEVLGEALLQLLRYHGSQALLPYRAHAGPDLAKAAPLVGAAFALEMSQQETAARLLATAKATDLGPWDLSVWKSLSDRLVDRSAQTF